MKALTIFGEQATMLPLPRPDQIGCEAVLNIRCTAEKIHDSVVILAKALAVMPFTAYSDFLEDVPAGAMAKIVRCDDGRVLRILQQHDIMHDCERYSIQVRIQ